MFLNNPDALQMLSYKPQILKYTSKVSMNNVTKQIDFKILELPMLV